MTDVRFSQSASSSLNSHVHGSDSSAAMATATRNLRTTVSADIASAAISGRPQFFLPPPIQPIEIAESLRVQHLSSQSRMVGSVAVGPEHTVGHAELGQNNKGADEFPHYLVSGGHLEQPAHKTFRNQSVAVGQALRPAGEMGEEGDHRQAPVLPHDLAGRRVHLDDPGIAESPTVGTVSSSST